MRARAWENGTVFIKQRDTVDCATPAATATAYDVARTARLSAVSEGGKVRSGLNVPPILTAPRYRFANSDTDSQPGQRLPCLMWQQVQRRHISVVIECEAGFRCGCHDPGRPCDVLLLVTSSHDRNQQWPASGTDRIPATVLWREIDKSYAGDFTTDCIRYSTRCRCTTN